MKIDVFLGNISIRNKILLFNSIVLITTFLVLLVFTLGALKSDNEISSQQQHLAKQELITQANYHFAEVRYWALDLSVSWLNEAEENLEVHAQALRDLLPKIEGFNPEFTTRISTTLEDYIEINLQAVDAYVDGNRVQGNAFVSRGRNTAATLNKEFTETLASINTEVDVSGNNVLTANAILIYVVMGAVVLVLLVSVLSAFGLAKIITRPLSYAVEIATRIASGDLGAEIVVDRKDETGKLLGTLDIMQTDLRNRIEADRAAASDNALIRQALDDVSSAVMVTDHHMNILYLNKANAQLFHTTQDEIRRSLKDFEPDNLLGQPVYNLDRQSKGTRFILEALDTLEETYTSEVEWGDLTLRRLIKAVKDENGKNCGLAIEWINRTDEVDREKERIKREAKERIIAAENSRVRQALDNVSTSSLIVDEDFKVIYANDAAKKMLTGIHSHTQINSHSLIGLAMDDIKTQLAQAITTHPTSEHEIGDDTFHIIANSVMSEGKKIGTVLEWENRTAQLSIEREIDELVAAASRGDFSRTIDESGKSGFHLLLGRGLNSLLQSTDSGIRDVLRVLSAIAQGDLSQTIDAHHQGIFLQLKDSANHTVNQLNQVMTEVGKLIDGANDGDFSRTIDVQDKQGFFKSLSDNLNTLMNTTGAGISDVLRVLTAIAQGDLSQTIDSQYRGTFLQLKDSANHTVNQLNEVMTEIGKLIDAANNGDFSSQIKVLDKQGFFKSLSDNLNTLMNTTDAGISDVLRVLTAIAQGDLSQTINSQYQGTFLQLKDSANHTVNQLNEVMTEIGKLIDAANNGDFSTQIKVLDKQGFFKSLSDNLNTLMNTTDAGISDVLRVLTAIAQGDLSQTINSQYQGTFLQLKDSANHTVNQLNEVMTEIGKLIDGANDGDFSTQIKVVDKQGFFKSLSDNLNNLMNTTDTGISDVLRVLSAIAQGDLSQTIDSQYQGTFLQLKEYANNTVLQLTQVMDDIGNLIDAANAGDFTGEIETLTKQGFFKSLSDNLNTLMGTTDAGISDVLRVLSAISQGDLSQTIHAQYQGTFLQLKEYSNHTVKQLTDVMNDIGELIDAANAGDFSQQINLQDKQGFFQSLSNNLNTQVSTTEEGLSDVLRVLSAIAKGDLQQTISQHYDGLFGQLKNDTNSTVDKLIEVIGQIMQGSIKIAEGTDRVSTNSKELIAGTQLQSSSLDKTATSMDEMTDIIRKGTSANEQASAMTDSAQQLAAEGGRVLGEAILAIDEIKASSNKMADIVSVLDELSFQTNLLALNAAVEAARAGEQGKGFAVVAAEVRSLAQRSSDSANEIKGLINDSIIKVDDGVLLVNKSGDSLAKIVESIEKVGELMKEIDQMAQEQNSRVSVVNSAIEDMKSITHTNENLVSEADTESRKMGNETREMRKLVSFFRVAHKV